MSDDNLDFDAFVEAVQEEQLEDDLVHEAAHSAAVSTRRWRDYSDKVAGTADRSV